MSHTVKNDQTANKRHAGKLLREHIREREWKDDLRRALSGDLS